MAAWALQRVRSFPDVLVAAPSGVVLAQAGPSTLPSWLLWFFVWGDPSYTVTGYAGALHHLDQGHRPVLPAGLDRLLGAGLHQESRPWASETSAWPTFWASWASSSAWPPCSIGVLVGYREDPRRFRTTPTAIGMVAALLFVLWAEIKLWSILIRQGTNRDRLVFIGMHLGLGARFRGLVRDAVDGRQHGQLHRHHDPGRPHGCYLHGPGRPVPTSSRWSSPRFWRIRWRRLYSIAWLCWTEAFRRMWAPWVVLAIFAVILAFTSWFLQPPRPAELGRLYVGTLMLLSSILLTLTVVILAPISLPNDVRQQTIFTTITKPVRRLELIWGRMIGYMALVTLLLLIFGGISLIYFERQVGAARREALAAAEKAELENKPEFAKPGPRAVRPALRPHVRPRAHHRLAHLLRLPEQSAQEGHRRRHGAAHPQLRRRRDTRPRSLSLRVPASLTP